MKVAVVGLGKIGLPFAVNAALQGNQVMGCDKSKETVDLINSGRCALMNEPFLEEGLLKVFEEGLLLATTSIAEAVRFADAVVVLVPVYVDELGESQFESIDQVTLEIAQNASPGLLVCYETTVPVGTTRNRFARTLADVSKLKLDEELMVCFSPERVSSGTVFQDLLRYPKLIGAIGPKSQKSASFFYRSVLPFDKTQDSLGNGGIWVLESSESAELAKLAETTYRDVNIALANQFARFSDTLGLDIYEIIKACNSQPFSHIHSPGIAVGGHCIPVYPKMYLEGDREAHLVAVARKVNESMPLYAVQRIIQSLGLENLEGMRAVILGLAYRSGVKEDAFSGTYQLKAALESAGSRVLVADPLYSKDEIVQKGFDAFEPGDLADVLILHTYDDSYAAISEADFPGLLLVFDGRNEFPENRFGSVPTIGLGRAHAQTRKINKRE